MHSCICFTFALLCINVSSKSIQEDTKLHLFDFSPRYVWLFSAMCFQMACLRWGKVTLILAFLHCVFLSVYSNCVSVRMQSHLVTFVWLFSTVCFQMSPEMACHRGCILHRHIGCICLIFLHCVFSNVNRQSHIGCICLTFLQSTFSNEPSDGLPENLLDKKHWFPELPCVW